MVSFEKPGRLFPWIIAGVVLWAVALLMIFQHVLFSDSSGSFEATRGALNAGLRTALLELGITSEHRSVKENKELLGNNGDTWEALNWRISVPEGFDVAHAGVRLQAAVESSSAHAKVRLAENDRELPLVLEAYIGDRLSHRLLFVSPVESPSPGLLANAESFLSERWDRLTGGRVDLDRQLYSAISAMGLNGPPLLIREYWRRPQEDLSAATEIPHWVVCIENGISAADAIEDLRSRVQLGRLSDTPSYLGDSVTVDVSFNGALSHRLIFSEQRDGRGLRLMGTKDVDSVLLTPPRVAIIIDDIGFDLAMADELMQLGAHLTLSIIPNQAFSTEIAVRAHKRGFETMIHLPMEPNDYPDTDPGRGAIYVNLAASEITRRTNAFLEAVPHASGVNNHMGSRAMADGEVVKTMLASVASHNLFFVDSRTSAKTIGLQTARSMGMPSAERSVFIDEVGNSDVAYRVDKLRELIRLARERGTVIGIGHPSRETIDALRHVIPEFLEAGVEIVYSSEVVS